MAIADRLRRVINTFLNNEPNMFNSAPGPSSSSRPSDQRTPRFFYNDKSMISSLYNRIAMDVAGIPIRHVGTDEDRRYAEDKDSGLQDCFILQPNIDQGPRQFRQDVAMTLFDMGVASVVPVDYKTDEEDSRIVDVITMRVGEVKEFFPKHVRVSVWNEEEGVRQDVVLRKDMTAVIQNPLYAVMNEPSGTLQRLMRKLSLLDSVDEASASGKLDLIIQLPYVVKSEARKQQAAQRAADIEFQLKGSQYGVAYTDGTEKITQLNRPAENNLLKQIEYLVNLLYGQLGVTPEIMNGTADEPTMLNYYNRTVIPIVEAIVEAEIRAFIGKPGMEKNEWIMFFTDPFKFVPMTQLADIVDKLARNEVMTSNEFRQKLGLKPSKDPKADQLINSNMPQSPPNSEVQEPERNRQNES